MNVCENLIGSIYTLKDASSTSPSDCGHNYIIISNNHSIHNFVQAMPITSMRNKEISIEVPIQLSNYLISYILPYNIQTFTNTELKMGKFRGTISDTKYMTSKDFINLLMDIYLMETKIGEVDKDKVKNEYDRYCNIFWENHKNSNEYREMSNNVKSTGLNNLISYLSKPIINWSNKEIKEYLDNFNNQSKYKVLGFRNKKEFIQFNFQVKKEMYNRSIK